jgi:hypothetical protein
LHCRPPKLPVLARFGRAVRRDKIKGYENTIQARGRARRPDAQNANRKTPRRGPRRHSRGPRTRSFSIGSCLDSLVTQTQEHEAILNPIFQTPHIEIAEPRPAVMAISIALLQSHFWRPAWTRLHKAPHPALHLA